MYFIYDLETSGLPEYTEQRGYYPPQNFEKYNTCRVVQISWIILNKELEIIDKQNHIIKPDGWIMDAENIAIHGVSNERAHSDGILFWELSEILRSNAQYIKTIVAHNVYFDYNVLQAEFHRYGEQDMAVIFNVTRKYCTMARGKELFMLPKNPKLKELYTMLYDEEITHEHDAEFDTLHCYKCFLIMKNMPDRSPEQIMQHKKDTRYYHKRPATTQDNEASPSKKRGLFFLKDEGST